MPRSTSRNPGLDMWPGGRSDSFKPKFLRKLENYVETELRALGVSTAAPSLSRVQVYKTAFFRFSDEFKSYSTFLNTIQNEYDTLLNEYAAKLHSVPQIEAENLSLRIGAGQKIEDLKKDFSAEKRELLEKLRNMKNLNVSMENENVALRSSISELQFSGKIHKEKHDEMRSSTVTLTNALVRLEDENAGRALVENTQQSEVLRLKSALEKANAEADRLKHLAVEMEDQIANLIPPQVLEEKEAHIGVLRREMTQMRAHHREVKAKYDTLNNAFTKAEEEDAEKQDSAHLPTNFVLDDLVEQIETLKKHLNEGKMQEDSANEDKNIEGEGFQPEGNFFEGKGYGEDVPEFLRYTGPMRNWRLSKRECERAVNDVWIAKEEWSEDNEDEEAIQLSDFLYIYLREKYEENQALVAEFGYNLIDALERYIDDSDCLIFLKILQGALAEEVRDDQLHLLVEIPRVMEDEDCALHSGVPSGMLQIASFIRILKKMLTTKSEHSFNKLQKALQFEAKKGRMIAYNEIFEEDEDGNQGDFCELLRAQHLEEIIAYSRKLRDAIEARAKKEESDYLRISILREVISNFDPDKQRADTNLYLARGAGCTIQDVVEKENNGEDVDVEEFIVKLGDGLLKKSEVKANSGGGVKE